MHPHQSEQPTRPHPPARRRKSSAGKWALITVGAIVATILAVVMGTRMIAFVVGGPADRTAEPETTAAIVSGIPKPDADQAEELLYGLREVDRALDEARSIDRARNTCSDLLAGKKRAQVVANTRIRFDGGSASVDEADAEQIVKLVEAGGWCR